jgi:hypothetical protein
MTPFVTAISGAPSSLEQTKTAKVYVLEGTIRGFSDADKHPNQRNFLNSQVWRCAWGSAPVPMRV